MTTSPFTKFVNATITVKIPLTSQEIATYYDGLPSPTDIPYGNAPLPFRTTGGLTPTITQNDDMGNRIHPAFNYTFTASLTNISGTKAFSAESLDTLSGLTEQTMYLKGYSVSPMILPLAVRCGLAGRAVIDGVPGTVNLFPIDPDPYGVQSKTGTRLKIKFVTIDVWNEGYTVGV